MSLDDLDKILKINADQIEQKIIELHQSIKLNGKKCADLLIRHWQASDPNYISENYRILFDYKPKEREPISVRMKQLPEEVLTFYQGPKGDYLHSFKYSGILTEEIKAVICEHLLLEYEQKIKEMGI